MRHAWLGRSRPGSSGCEGRGAQRRGCAAPALQRVRAEAAHASKRRKVTRAPVITQASNGSHCEPRAGGSACPHSMSAAEALQGETTRRYPSMAAIAWLFMDRVGRSCWMPGPGRVGQFTELAVAALGRLCAHAEGQWPCAAAKNANITPWRSAARRGEGGSYTARPGQALTCLASIRC